MPTAIVAAAAKPATPHTESDRERAAAEWRELVARCAAEEDMARLKAAREWRALVAKCASEGRP